MLEKDKDQIQFLVYSAPEPVKFFEFSAQKIKHYFSFFPLLILLLLLLLLYLAFFQKPFPSSQKGYSEKTEISIQEQTELKAELSELRSGYLKLQEKLLVQQAADDDGLWFGPIRKPYAFQNLLANQLLRLEALNIEKSDKQLKVRFNLVNNGSEDKKVSGYLFLVHYFNQGLEVYPVFDPTALSEGVRFDKGESFAVSRLRPVEAIFSVKSNTRVIFYAFSREGDLLMKSDLPLK
jgi:hypothetical protein